MTYAMRWSPYIILFIYRDKNDIRSNTYEERYLHVIGLIKQKQNVISVDSSNFRGHARAYCSVINNEYALAKFRGVGTTLGVTVVHLAFPLRLIMQFSSEAFFIAANSQSYFCRPSAFVRHPICISRAPFRDLHSSQPQCFRRVAGNT